MFNKDSRTNNAMKATALGLVNQLISLVLGFVFRTAFLKILSEEYLGLNSLFSGVLGILSLAELGIGYAIIYRLYTPVSHEDLKKISALLDFYKKVYRIIMLVIAAIGLCLTPFIKFFINKDSIIPEDINIYIIFVLFVLQSVSSYTFVYKQGLLIADQRNYQLSIIAIISNVLKYSLQLLVLFLTKKYIFTVIIVIVSNLFLNGMISLYVTKKYPDIFKIKEKLDKSERKLILKDTYALLCHRIAGTILNSTDTILITSFIGLAIGGLYSNYTIITVSVLGFALQLLTTFTGSIGNLNVNESADHKYSVYKRLLFMNLWVASFVTVGIFVLSNPFIDVWLGADFLLSQWVVLIIAINIFIATARNINNSFISATGLFKLDKARPFIEAALNLIVSIGLILLFRQEKWFGGVYDFLGIRGKENLLLIAIFTGTTISTFGVAVWREVYLLYKHIFHKKVWHFWVMYGYAVLNMIASGGISYYLCSLMSNKFIVVKFLIVIILPNLFFVLTTFFTKEFKYYFLLFMNLAEKLLIKLKLKKKNLNSYTDESTDLTESDDEGDNNKNESDEKDKSDMDS